MQIPEDQDWGPQISTKHCLKWLEWVGGRCANPSINSILWTPLKLPIFQTDSTARMQPADKALQFPGKIATQKGFIYFLLWVLLWSNFRAEPALPICSWKSSSH